MSEVRPPGARPVNLCSGVRARASGLHPVPGRGRRDSPGHRDAIDMLVDDAALFTGPDGNLATKADDLAVHRSGHQKLERSEELDLRVLVHGSSGVTWFHGVLEGSLGGESFGARLRYTRAWAHDAALGWRVLAAHAAIVGPADH